MRTPTPLISAEQIRTRVGELATALAQRIPDGETPHLIGVLKGGFMFLADLVRAIPRPVTVDFARLVSYGSGTTSSGAVELVTAPHSVRGRHVVIVEDIVDTGLSLRRLRQHLLDDQPQSLCTVALLTKPGRRQSDVPTELVGFALEGDRFVVGYGLDYAHHYRGLPYIAVVQR
jgi:hypoxanthine phosphoribosyltransferase